MVYKLKGIVIHSGDASAGHYYSFIRNHSDSNWTEYNDSIVRPWDHKSRLLRDCFGGPHASENSWSWQAKNDASVSAYMLVYEKQVSLDCKGDEHMEYSQCINPVELYSAGLSGGVARQIRRDNKYFALLKQSLDSTYLTFLANVIEKATDFEVKYFSQVGDNSRLHLHDQSLKHAKNEVPCDFTRSCDGMDLYIFVLRAYIYVFQRVPVSESANYNSRIGKCVQKLFSLRSISKRRSCSSLLF